MTLNPLIILSIFGLALIIRPDIWETIMRVSNATRGLDTNSNYPLRFTGRAIGVILFVVGLIFGSLIP